MSIRGGKGNRKDTGKTSYTKREIKNGEKEIDLPRVRTNNVKHNNSVALVILVGQRSAVWMIMIINNVGREHHIIY